MTNSFVGEAYKPTRTETSCNEDFARMEKYIEKHPASCIYTSRISCNEPFTKDVRKVMTENVKTSAYSLSDQEKPRSNDGKFAGTDQKIYNFAREEVLKNASASRPAKLNEALASYMKSVALISCGEVQGTCFLVTKDMVITNYHIYRMIEEERCKPGKMNLPIQVCFDYFNTNETVNIFEVDEQQNTELQNPFLDYKFFRLKQSGGLEGRIPLGPIVRNFQLADGRVVILGHPEGKVMQDEVCIVVGYGKCLDRIRERHKRCNGVHMTNEQLLEKTEKYQGKLSYDSTFFSGSSGSPVFDMDGNIVAIHTQGYLLEREETDAIQANESDLNLSNANQPKRKVSLMEFGVQFFVICRDIRQWHNESVVKQIFPNYAPSRQMETPMDQG